MQNIMASLHLLNSWLLRLRCNSRCIMNEVQIRTVTSKPRRPQSAAPALVSRAGLNSWTRTESAETANRAEGPPNTDEESDCSPTQAICQAQMDRLGMLFQPDSESGN